MGTVGVAVPGVPAGECALVFTPDGVRGREGGVTTGTFRMFPDIVTGATCVPALAGDVMAAEAATTHGLGPVEATTGGVDPTHQPTLGMLQHAL
mmetsp:Transcript_45567/g.105694  ORF Transcript_45567/g.105694 Transcript_45567/m.105694 type:complete len:94 (+) Transcript_45567:1735-2016(+)